MLGHAALGGVIAFALAVLTTPVGVSGAVFLIPVQISVLHTPSPALTPTNLLYNVLATPGALWRYSRRAPIRAPLTATLVLGTLPGVVVGAVLRVEVLSGPTAFYFVIAAVLVPRGAWLAVGRAPTSGRTPPSPRSPRIVALALAVGVIGGIYGIGGGGLPCPPPRPRAVSRAPGAPPGRPPRPSSPRSAASSPTPSSASATAARSRRSGSSACRWEPGDCSAPTSAPGWSRGWPGPLFGAAPGS